MWRVSSACQCVSSSAAMLASAFEGVSVELSNFNCTLIIASQKHFLCATVSRTPPCCPVLKPRLVGWTIDIVGLCNWSKFNHPHPLIHFVSKGMEGADRRFSQDKLLGRGAQEEVSNRVCVYTTPLSFYNFYTPLQDVLDRYPQRGSTQVASSLGCVPRVLGSIPSAPKNRKHFCQRFSGGLTSSKHFSPISPPYYCFLCNLGASPPPLLWAPPAQSKCSW